MRLLANENVPRDLVAALRRTGHDVAWVRDERPGIADGVVLAWARSDRRLLLTFDKDFGELAFRWGLPAECGIVLVRVGPESLGGVCGQVLAALEAHGEWAGHFSVIEEGRVRTNPLPQR